MLRTQRCDAVLLFQTFTHSLSSSTLFSLEHSHSSFRAKGILCITFPDPVRLLAVGSLLHHCVPTTLHVIHNTLLSNYVLMFLIDVQIYLDSKSTITVFFIVKCKVPWIRLDGRKSKIDIRKFPAKKRDRNLGWPLPAPVWKQRAKRSGSGKMAGCCKGLWKDLGRSFHWQDWFWSV